MLLSRKLINYTVTKEGGEWGGVGEEGGEEGVRVLIYFPTLNNLTNMFTRIWIETHFSLLHPVVYFS